MCTRIIILLCLVASVGRAAYLEKADVAIRDGANLDAFSRLRVSEIQTLGDFKQIVPLDAEIFVTSYTTNATITYDQANAQSKLNVTNASGIAIFSTRQSYNYEPGKSQIVLATFRADGSTGTVSRIGYFSDDAVVPHTNTYDGLYFEIQNGTGYCVVAKAGTLNRVAQPSWNVDPMDGTGPSGISIDWTKAQILIIDFQYLGVGRVRFYFDINGVPYLVHQFLHANEIDSVYMRSANQPLRAEIISSGGTGQFAAICATVGVEGGSESQGITFGKEATNSFSIATATDNATLWAIRLQTNKLTTVVTVENLDFSAVSLGASEGFKWELVLNPSNTSTLDFQSVTNSSIQIASSPNVVTTGGVALAFGYISSVNESGSTLPLTRVHIGTQLDHTRDILLLRVSSRGANGDVIYSGVNWREFQ